MGLACNFFGYAHTLTRMKRYGNADDLAPYFAKWIGRRIEALDDGTNFTAPWQRETVRSQLQEAEAVFTALVRE